ncbi:kallistatin [Nannospalax galili]|uniref:kallistatin n=1 Tax=Nannospalax galili TaxID=1026970 RepID=UPI0004ED0E05|nr:kallistatin [Nannospalax galili]XP_029421479.1 kallistatin [Nannospalax galili]
MHCVQYLALLLAGLLALSHSYPLEEQAGRDDSFNATFERLQFNAYDAPSRKVAPSNIDFAFRLYHLIASQSSGKNIFFSPISISTALAMLSLGAGGDSRTQILKSLGFNLTELPLPIIHEGFRFTQRVLSLPIGEVNTYVGNALVLSQDLEPLPEFTRDTKGSYNTELLRTDFRDVEGTTQLINHYVKEKTHGMITNFVSGGLSPDIKMVLLNYIYFQGLWVKPFPFSGVVVRDFHVDENTVVKVPMMLQDQREHWYIHDKRVPCSVLRMDYRGEAVAFFILPREGKMKEVEQVLSPGMLERWNRLLQHRYFYRTVELYLPKFSISNSYALDQILPDLGFQDLFSSRANFSGITKQEKLKLSKSLHKATLEVNEIGTKAAATTRSFFSLYSAHYYNRVLMFNRPFFIVIFSTSAQTIIFLGKVFNPTAP